MADSASLHLKYLADIDAPQLEMSHQNLSTYLWRETPPSASRLCDRAGDRPLVGDGGLVPPPSNPQGGLASCQAANRYCLRGE